MRRLVVAAGGAVLGQRASQSVDVLAEAFVDVVQLLGGDGRRRRQ